MDYLYFDTECCDGHHICSFGYIIVDENFNVTEHRDILINPQWRFMLNKSGIDLAYPESEFYSAPPFYKIYDEIRRLLTAEDRVLLGHAVSADIDFLDKACARYNKKRLNISAFDTQRIYAKFSGSSTVRSLEKILEELEISSKDLTAHKSSDDAKMTMLVVKEICRRGEMSAMELLEKSKRFIVNRRSIKISGRRKIVKKAVDGVRKSFADGKTRTPVYIKDVMESYQPEKVRRLARALYKHGFSLALDIDKCEYCIGCNRSEMHAEFPDVKCITFSELSELLGVRISDNGEPETRETKRGARKSLKKFFDKVSPKRSQKAE